MSITQHDIVTLCRNIAVDGARTQWHGHAFPKCFITVYRKDDGWMLVAHLKGEGSSGDAGQSDFYFCTGIRKNMHDAIMTFKYICQSQYPITSFPMLEFLTGEAFGRDSESIDLEEYVETKLNTEPYLFDDIDDEMFEDFNIFSSWNVV